MDNSHRHCRQASCSLISSSSICSHPLFFHPLLVKVGQGWTATPRSSPKLSNSSTWGLLHESSSPSSGEIKHLWITSDSAMPDKLITYAHSPCQHTTDVCSASFGNKNVASSSCYGHRSHTHCGWMPELPIWSLGWLPHQWFLMSLFLLNAWIAPPTVQDNCSFIMMHSLNIWICNDWFTAVWPTTSAAILSRRERTAASHIKIREIIIGV